MTEKKSLLDTLKSTKTPCKIPSTVSNWYVVGASVTICACAARLRTKMPTSHHAQARPHLMYMCLSVLVPTCTVSAAQFFLLFSSRLLNRMRVGDHKHRNENVWPNARNKISPVGAETPSQGNDQQRQFPQTDHNYDKVGSLHTANIHLRLNLVVQ